jgi:hypothetical protein
MTASFQILSKLPFMYPSTIQRDVVQLLTASLNASPPPSTETRNSGQNLFPVAQIFSHTNFGLLMSSLRVQLLTQTFLVWFYTCEITHTSLRSKSVIVNSPVLRDQCSSRTRARILVITAAQWALGLRSNTAISYEGQLWVYWIINHGQPTRGCPPARGLGRGVITYFTNGLIVINNLGYIKHREFV